MQNPSEGCYIEYDNLPQINSLDQQLLQQLDTLMSGPWTDCFQGITALRSINKFYPQCTPDAIARYMNLIVDLINNGKTQIVKNSFALIKEVFQVGKNINVEKAVLTFTGLMIKKGASEIGKVKEMANDVLVEFANNCGYDISFVIVAEYCCDKNVAVAEISIKLMAKLIGNIAMQITQLKPQTLQTIMKALTFLLDSKRPNMKTWAKEICMFIYNTIGNENYLSLMNYVLSKEEMELMITEMQPKKLTKAKETIPLASILKERKSMMTNQKLIQQQQQQQQYYPTMMNNQPFSTNSSLLNTPW